MSIFNDVLESGKQESLVRKQYDHIVNLQNNQTLKSDRSLVQAAIATESLDATQTQLAKDKLRGIVGEIESFIHDKEYMPAIESYNEARPGYTKKQGIFSFGDGSTKAQTAAAIAGALLAADPRAALEEYRKIDAAPLTLNPGEVGVVIPAANVPNIADRVNLAMESYDESDIRNSAAYTIIFNANSARQDEFGETLFPTLVQAPDQVGFTVSIDLQMVMDEITHKISGDVEEWNQRNIIRAIENPDILKKDLTRLIPVYREDNKKYLADPADIPSYTTVLDGEEIETAPLKMEETIDLIGISTRDSILEKGVPDNTDSLDRMVLLKNIYFKTKGGDIIKFNTLQLPTNNFVFAQQGNWRNVALNFDTTSLLVNEKTKQVDGSDLADLGDVATNKYNVRISAYITGQINLETSHTRVFSNKVKVHSCTNEDGDLVALDTIASIVEAIEGGEIKYYDLEARKSNTNVRQRGQLINNQRYYQKYEIALRSPFTSLHPINNGGEPDTSDIERLLVATQFAIRNEAVTSLLEAKDTLAAYVHSNDSIGNAPELLGVGRHLVIPTYYEDTIDLSKITDSLKSHERAIDIQAAIVNMLRHYTYQMYVHSQYKPAADYLNGGVSPNPTVIVATDPEISRYIIVPSDIRTLGMEFDLRVVTTLDRRMKGKLFMMFSNFNESRNTSIDPLSFGNMIYAPEVVISANISRGGQISKETMVQPRFRFITHCPIMTYIEVKGIYDTVANKNVVNIHEVQP